MRTTGFVGKQILIGNGFAAANIVIITRLRIHSSVELETHVNKIVKLIPVGLDHIDITVHQKKDCRAVSLVPIQHLVGHNLHLRPMNALIYPVHQKKRLPVKRPVQGWHIQV
jgi:hypothetical protein